MGSGGQAIRLRQKQPELLAQAGWKGVRDSLDPTQHNPELCYFLQNVYPKDPFVGAGLLGRPGFSRTAAQIAAQDVQAVGQYSKLDGTEITFAVVGGEVYKYTWSTSMWSKEIATADLTGASITLASTGRVYWEQFADELVFTDGTNTPFTWDGTNGGGLTSLTNAPVAFGAPVVYYYKLFFIKDAERATIVWSEEGDATTGYEAGGFNNAWTLGQTDSDELYALMATNEALFYFRERSTGAIWGEVTTNFQTTGTQEAVSSSVGTRSPDGVVRVGSRVFFMDAEGRVQAIDVGGQNGGLVQPEPWRLARQTLGLQIDSQIEQVIALYNPDLDLVHFAVATEIADTLNEIINIHPVSALFVGKFTGYDIFSMGLVKDADNDQRPVLMHGDDGGVLWDWGVQDDGPWQDEDTGGSAVAIRHVVETAPFAYDVRGTKILQRLDLSLLSDGMTGLLVKLTTERGVQVNGLTWSDASGASALWDSAVWDSASWSSGRAEVTATFAPDVYFRWARVRLEHETLNDEFGLIAAMMEVYPEGADIKWP